MTILALIGVVAIMLGAHQALLYAARFIGGLIHGFRRLPQ